MVRTSEGWLKSFPHRAACATAVVASAGLLIFQGCGHDSFDQVRSTEGQKDDKPKFKSQPQPGVSIDPGKKDYRFEYCLEMKVSSPNNKTLAYFERPSSPRVYETFYTNFLNQLGCVYWPKKSVNDLVSQDFCGRKAWESIQPDGWKFIEPDYRGHGDPNDNNHSFKNIMEEEFYAHLFVLLADAFDTCNTQADESKSDTIEHRSLNCTLEIPLSYFDGKGKGDSMIRDFRSVSCYTRTKSKNVKEEVREDKTVAEPRDWRRD